jgi:hypothetical protein
LQEARQTPKEEDELQRVESVLVFTDGEANQGIQDKVHSSLRVGVGS